jgi:hypothetical protein
MDVGDDGVFHLLADDFKTPKLVFRFGPAYLLVTDKSSETCIMECGAESVKFITPALGGQFHTSIGQIADRAGDLKAGRDGLGGVAETDPLDAAGIQQRHPAACRQDGVICHGRIKANGTAGRKYFFENLNPILIKIFLLYV